MAVTWILRALLLWILRALLLWILRALLLTTYSCTGGGVGARVGVYW